MVSAGIKIRIPANCRVFVLDDAEGRLRWFRKSLQGVAAYRDATSAARAIEILEAEQFDVVFLDHDLGFLDAADPTRQHGNGKEVARFLAIRKFAGKIVIHSRNLDAVPFMCKILPKATTVPFGEFDIALTAAAAR
jgi:CheY-like chemotaxis protein